MPEGQPPDHRKPGSIEITPELVQKISERVISMLLYELKIEKERYHILREGNFCGKGSRYGR